MIESIVKKILAGGELQFEEALGLAEGSDAQALYQAADGLRKTLHNNSIDLCSVVSASSGQCTENCRFCAQSIHYEAEAGSEDLIDVVRAVRLARENERSGAHHFSLVTAGRSVSEKHLEEFRTIYKGLKEQTSLSLCASMGFLTPEKAAGLKEMGVSHYHCNLETCRSFFPTVCTSHTWDEKVATIRIAQNAGLEVCSGGIIGMGESFTQRLELAFELRELGISSIPLSVLTPIKDTPFAEITPLTVAEVLTCVAMFRFILPQAVIRIAGSRHLLAEEGEQWLSSGANGLVAGDHLPIPENGLQKDLQTFAELSRDKSETEKKGK